VIHVDYEVLRSLQEVMEGEYPVLLETFLNDSEERLAQLQHALAHQATGLLELSMAAHSFKGSSGNLGAVRLAELCSLLEIRAQEKRWVGVEELVAQINAEFLIVHRLFTTERQRFNE
jgi:HPt (histidine-containing phosphotransfer) domain-containing protein